MSEYELRRLAKMIVEIQSQDEAWLMAFAKAQAKLMPPRLVSAKEAAGILGISVSCLYKIKDDDYGIPRFTYIKGGSKSSPLKFDANAIVGEYEKYIKSQECRTAQSATPVYLAVI